MHVLLLGGHGKVALHLTPLLLNRGWSVTSVIRNPTHESEILALGKGLKGTLNVLLSSLEDVKSASDAQKIIDTVTPDYVVWSAGKAPLTPHPLKFIVPFQHTTGHKPSKAKHEPHRVL
jgi:nucleoside-diphosphate-sugar epimerase